MLLDTMGARLAVSTKSVEFLPSERLSAISYDATHTPDLLPTLAIVALFAEGESVIKNAEIINRGYDDLVGKLCRLGASVKMKKTSEN
jgi:3-phosphoshikimate 1-carboxyvinyltransferase